MDTTTIYRVDNHDRIIALGGYWDEFAMDNNTPSVIAENIIETPLFEHIQGDETRMFIYTILSRARDFNKTLSYHYRCDSPTEKRFMQMVVSPDLHRNVTFTHRQLRTEKSNHQAIFLPGEKHMKHTVRCSMCNAIKMNNQWIDPFDQCENITCHVIYSVCGDCRLQRPQIVKHEQTEIREIL